MKKRKRDIFETLRKARRRERRLTLMMMFFVGIIGVIAGKCSNSNQNTSDFKGVIVPDSTKSFQPGDTIKVILINEKQR